MNDIRISLNAIQTAAGLLIALATSIAALWVTVAKPSWIDKGQFKQARNLGTLIIAVGLGLIWVLWGKNGTPDDLHKLGTVAQIGVPLCIAAFLLNVMAQILTRPQSPGPLSVIIYLLTLITYVPAGSLSLSSVTVMLLMVYAPATAARTASLATDSPVFVTALVKGERVSEQPGAPVEFRVSSSQVNFGCGQRATASARTAAPPGASVMEVNAEWANFANAKDKSTEVTREGNDIVAHGVIAGLDPTAISLPFGAHIENCLGGGHGELVLRGKYVGTQRTPVPYEVTLTGTVTTATPLRVTLPSSSDLKLSEALLEFRANPGQEPSRLKVPIGASQDQTASNSIYLARVENGQIVVERRTGS